MLRLEGCSILCKERLFIIVAGGLGLIYSLLSQETRSEKCQDENTLDLVLAWPSLGGMTYHEHNEGEDQPLASNLKGSTPYVLKQWACNHMRDGIRRCNQRIQPSGLRRRAHKGRHNGKDGEPYPKSRGINHKSYATVSLLVGEVGSKSYRRRRELRLEPRQAWRPRQPA